MSCYSRAGRRLFKATANGTPARPDNDASQAMLREWPTEPQQLGQITLFTVLGRLCDFLLLMAPVAFFGNTSLTLT